MKQKITKSEMKALNALLAKDLKFKNHLKRFIFVNTYEPKFKIGDTVITHEHGHYINGETTNGYPMVITKVLWLRFTDDPQAKPFYEGYYLVTNNGVPSKECTTGCREDEITKAKNPKPIEIGKESQQSLDLVL